MPAIAWTMAILVSIPNSQITNLPILTSTRGVLAAEIAGLVAADNTGRLDLGSWATGKASVKVHHALHASGILGGADSLVQVSRRLTR